MRLTVRFILTTVAAAGLAPVALAQQAPASKPGSARPAAISKADKAKLDQVLATVNGEKITRGQFQQFLFQMQIPPGDEATAYASGMDVVIARRLLNQFLNENHVPVKDEDINKVVDEQRRVFAEEKTSLETALAQSGTSLDELRDTIRTTLQWKEFINKTATDATLKAYMEANKDAFNNTLVKASHIQINYDPETASADEKAKAKEKLLAIKKEIVSGKISFADAANKYSEDPTNKQQPSGGDLRWFPRKRFPESFAVPAFALPKGQISDPVESDWGLHLIQVVDRREGKLPTLEQIKEKVLNQYATDEQNRIVAEMRKKAKIDIRPMPADFFGPSPSPSDATKAGTPKF
jgi:parvulin-like peptidyl-prolyl isomerase